MKPEALRNQSTKKSKGPIPDYQSNPFSLSFDKFGQFFEKNLGWAITLIVAAFLITIVQFIPQTPALLEPEDPGSDSSMQRTEKATTSSLYKEDKKTQPSDEIDEMNYSPEVIALIVSVIAIILVFILAINILIQTFLTGLFTHVALESDAGRHATLRGAIDAVVARFRRLFLAQLLASLKILGWTLLFIIPGIIAAFRYMLLPYVIMDESPKNKGVTASHDRVKAIVAGRKREVFGVATVAAIIPVIGVIAQYVGNAALYRQLQVYTDQNIEKAPVHWLNYFGFFLIGIYSLFIIALVALAILVASI